MNENKNGEEQAMDLQAPEPSGQQPPAEADTEAGQQIEPKDEPYSGEQSELSLVAKERDEYLDLLQRKQAEFENFRKRIQKERIEDQVAVRSELIRDLLPVIDSCETALERLRSDEAPPEQQPFLEGYELLFRQLKGVLEKFKVSEVPGVGSLFDPNVHEAVLRDVSEDHQDGEILEEYRKGYLLGDRLLRPSQVKVAVQP